MQEAFKKTRFAPTPSGYLHVGNILSFAITEALARRTGAKILLRIDDMDRERTVSAYVQDIFDTLDFLEIGYDEGPRNLHEYETEFAQAHRDELYKKALNQLRESGELFACTCTRTQLRNLNPDLAYPGICKSKNHSFDEHVSWRINTTGAGQINVNTLGRGPIVDRLPANMQDFIVKKKDGLAAYQLTSVIDDVYFGVDLVVRGADLWTSTLAQHYLSSVLHFDSISHTTFYHHPLLFDEAGHKLSKSEGATAVHHLRQMNKKPADIYEQIARMLGINARPASWVELVGLLDFERFESR